MRDYPVPFETWKIGMEFWMSDSQYRVTDVGSRTIAAICIEVPFEILVTKKDGGTKTDVSSDTSWFNGPPYAVAEYVMDENDLEACTLEKPDDGE